MFKISVVKLQRLQNTAKSIIHHTDKFTVTKVSHLRVIDISYCIYIVSDEICSMAEKLTLDEKRSYAEMLYMRGDLELKEIARIVGVHVNTMTNWSNDDEMKWKEKRRSFMVTKQEIIRRIYSILDKLSTQAEQTDDAGDTKAADKFIKYTAALKNLETDASIADIMEVGMAFVKWLQPIDPSLAMSVGNHLDKFIKERLKRF